MKKVIVLLLVSVFMFAKTYIVSQKDSKISFSIKKLIFINVDGDFTKFNGKVNADGKKINSIYGEIDSTSVLTDSDKRDKELKAFESMLWVEKYPKIVFKTTFIASNEIIASLTIKNVTQTVIFNVDSLKISDKKVEILISSNILREAFNINGFPVAVDSEVKISGKIVAY